MKRINLIIVNIPKNLNALKTVLKYVGDSWDKFDMKEWVLTEAAEYIYYDTTRKDYNYTNYEQDYNSDFFKRKNLIQLDYKEIL